MTETRYNLYKKRQAFRCVHDVHEHFKAEMSPFHILVQKQCYPHGCIYFKWKCRLLAKRKKCFRNFENVGRECFNCRYFYEEKIHQYPEFMDGAEEFSSFSESFREFEEWVGDLRSRRVAVEGTVNFVSPELTVVNTSAAPGIRFTGFLVRFQRGYIDNVPFEDPFFLRISAITQQQLKIRRDDEMDFMARLEIDRGRFRFIKSGNFNFYQRGTSEIPDRSWVLDRIGKSRIHSVQNAKCLSCRYGNLADIQNAGPGPSRALVCFMGIADAETCERQEIIDRDDTSESCANPKWQGKGCHQPV
jgi:hypothetical protein